MIHRSNSSVIFYIFIVKIIQSIYGLIIVDDFESLGPGKCGSIIKESSVYSSIFCAAICQGDSRCNGFNIVESSTSTLCQMHEYTEGPDSDSNVRCYKKKDLPLLTEAVTANPVPTSTNPASPSQEMAPMVPYSDGYCKTGEVANAAYTTSRIVDGQTDRGNYLSCTTETDATLMFEDPTEQQPWNTDCSASSSIFVGYKNDAGPCAVLKSPYAIGSCENRNAKMGTEPTASTYYANNQMISWFACDPSKPFLVKVSTGSDHKSEMNGITCCEIIQ